MAKLSGRRQAFALVMVAAVIAIGIVPAVGAVLGKAQSSAVPAVTAPPFTLTSAESPAVSGDVDTRTSFCALKSNPAVPYSLSADPATPSRSNCAANTPANPVVLDPGNYNPLLGTQFDGPTRGGSETSPSGWYVYDRHFKLACPTASISIEALADNSTSVFLNGGVALAAQADVNNASNWQESGTPLVYPPSGGGGPVAMFHAGDNVVEFVVHDLNGITGLDYTITVTPGECGTLGALKICKVAGNGVPLGTLVPFTVTSGVPTTTVAGASNGTAVGGFTGAQSLTVAKTSGFPASGDLHVATSTGSATMSYTGETATTFDGVATKAGTGTLTKGGLVSADAANGTAGASDVTVKVPAGPAPGGYCDLVGTDYAVGSPVNIVETVPSGEDVASITTNATSSDPEILAGSDLITPGLGVTEVTFTDESATSGYLEICKKISTTVVPPASAHFDFTVAGRTVSVPVNACSSPISLTAGNAIAVHESAHMTACSTFPANFATCDVTTDTASVKVTAGILAKETVLTVSNACKQVPLARSTVKSQAGLNFAAGHFTAADDGHPVFGSGVADGATISVNPGGTVVTMSTGATATMITGTPITVC